MGLDPETVRRMGEFFRDQTCCRCGRPAVRFARGKFYCAEDYPYGPSADAEGRRVYKCPRWAKRNS